MRILALTLLFSGCGFRAGQSNLEQKKAKQKAFVESQSFDTNDKCAGPSGSYQGGCADIYKGFSDDKALVAKWCNGVSDNACSQKVFKLFETELKKRYWAASIEEAYSKCDSHDWCKGAKNIEFFVASDHNINLRKMALDNLKLEALEEGILKNMELKQRMNRLENQNRVTNCTTTPNGYGGFNSTCN